MVLLVESCRDSLLGDSLLGGSKNHLLSPVDVSMDEEIAEGLTAKVFIGRYKGQTVAVKEFRMRTDSMSSKFRTNLEREVSILKRVSHPNLVEFIGVAEV